MFKCWCGKPCAECEHPCRYDEKLPCSPDCPNLGDWGGFTEACVNCEVYKDFVGDLQKGV